MTLSPAIPPSEAALRRTVLRLELLSEVTAQLLASEPQQIVESLCRKVMPYLDCHVFFNFLLDEKRQQLHLNACAGIPNDAARQIEWLEYGVAVCGCVARDGCRIVAENIQTTLDPRANLVRSFGVQAYACHPLLNQGRVIGTLSFGSRSRTKFEEDDLALMKAVADQVAIAMQRIRLIESLEHQAAEAQAANVAKSQFLTNISHELRTPMTAILGMTDVALGEPLSPSVRDCLQTARESADVLLKLLNEILDFSQVETGQISLESAPFSLRAVLGQTLKTMDVRASEKGLDLCCDVADDVPDRLVGDALRLRQVLVNLIANAVKFTADGSVTVAVRASSRTRDAASLEFAIRDTGIGIAQKDQAKIFRPFTQIDASMTRRFGGAGLGLAIASSMVQRMGGQIQVESSVGQGSTFRFVLPLPVARVLLPTVVPASGGVPSAACTEPARSGTSCLPRPLRVLLAEDTAANQKLVVRILSKRGHSVEVAANGQEAVELARRCRFDVILMDVQMPVMDGFQATAEIRGQPSSPPIIALTAHATKGDRERCLAAGMDDYLSKPVDCRSLVELVERLGTPGAVAVAAG